MFTLKNYLNLPVASALLCAAGLLSSCDSNPFDEKLPPCKEPLQAVRFTWDTNMLGADAFRGNVHSVSVYLFDQNDVLAYEFAEKGDALAQQGYTLALPGVAPGNYTIVAWCGLDNDTRSESFIVSDTEIGKTTRQELICRMEREVEDGIHYSREQLYDLYHGTAYAEVYSKDSPFYTEDQVFQVNLTKDTNNVRVLLQQFGRDVDVNDFSFCIEEANGVLASDNELKDDEVINYEPFHTEDGVAGVVEGTRAEDGAIEGLGVAIADMKMSRLIAKSESVLTIRNSDGSRVLQIPMTQYALLARPFEAASFTPQEYLDRQDNYRLMFFLDSNGAWMNTQILINGWTVYDQPTNMGNND